MNLILLEQNDFTDGLLKAVLGGRRAEHIRQVLKSAVGDTLKVGLLNGKMGTAKIVEIKDKIILNVKLTKNPPPKLDVILIVALPRPPMIKRILFTAAAMGQFGSGWAWLVRNNEGKLEVYSTPNQDSPLLNGHTPIITLDVWEHAYYLKYQNKRAEYIENWWQVVKII